MEEVPYDRGAAVEYARLWARKRNPAYWDFERLGGDCTNFVSQCLFAGAGIMNYTKDTGWYYRSLQDRAAAWTGVEYLSRFLQTNGGVGPFARTVPESLVLPGDAVQLGRDDGRFYHTALITETHPRILIACHSYDAWNRPLSSYHVPRLRFLHIEAVRKETAPGSP